MAKAAIQAQLEATEARIYAVDQQLTARLDRATGVIEKLGERMDGLTVQVRQFNSGMSELKGWARQILQALDRQTDAINTGLKVAESQSAHISELSQLVVTQASTVDCLIRRMEA